MNGKNLNIHKNYRTIGTPCHRLQKVMTKCDEVEELMSEDEEADERLLLHAAHAVKDGYSSIIISSEDTYVYVLCLAFSDTIEVPLFHKCRTQTHRPTRLIDIRQICSAIGSQFSKTLIGLYAFTGCDSVSAFAGKGKIRALELIKTSEDARKTFIQLEKIGISSQDYLLDWKVHMSSICNKAGDFTN